MLVRSILFYPKIEDKPVFDFSETTEITTLLTVVPIIPLSQAYTRTLPMQIADELLGTTIIAQQSAFLEKP